MRNTCWNGSNSLLIDMYWTICFDAIRSNILLMASNWEIGLTLVNVFMSRLGFFRSGFIYDALNSAGYIPVASEFDNIGKSCEEM